MNSFERRNKIVDMVNTQGSVLVLDPSNLFGISEVTIRADLRLLEEKGLLTRFHGGAARAGSDLTDAENQEVVLEDRYQLASDPKKRIAHAAGGVVEQHLLLFGAHQFKQGARLAEVVAVVFAVVPVGGIAVDFQRRLGVLRLLLPLAEAVGLVVRFAAVVGVYAALAVAVVAVYGAAGGIHRDLVVVDT